MRTVSALRVKLAVLLALAVFLLPATSLGRVLTFCKMSGRLGQTCCCHGADHQVRLRVPKLAAEPTQAKRPGCCEQRLTKSAQILTAQTEVSAPVPSGVLIAELSVPEVCEREPVNVTVPRAARGPPPLGPPLYIRNCSLLN